MRVNTSTKKDNLIEVGMLALVSSLGYLFVLDNFWIHDDWYFLANAAGLTNLEKGGSRWISYVGYWKLLYPIFGFDSIGWAISRIILHFLGVLLVFRIALQCSLPRGAALFSAVVFASSPVVFESLCWGTGAVEILGTVFTLAAINQWLRQTGWGIILSVLFGVMAIWSKETGMFLPLFFIGHILIQKRKSLQLWVAAGALLLSAFVAGILLVGNLSGEVGYTISFGSVVDNFLILGFWLIAPPPFQMGSEVGVFFASLVGGSVWGFWIIYSIISIRKQEFLPLGLLLVCVFSLVPVLPLENHVVPRYNYGPAAALAVFMGYMLKNLFAKKRIGFLFIVTVAAVFYSGWGVYFRENARFPTNNRLIHRLVLKEEISRKVCNYLETLDLNKNDNLIFFKEPDGNQLETQYLYESLGGSLGPKIVLGRDKKIKWASSIGKEDVGAFVISVNGLGLEPRGRYFPKTRK